MLVQEDYLKFILLALTYMIVSPCTSISIVIETGGTGAITSENGVEETSIKHSHSPLSIR